jgi:hypothetical protein
MPPDADERNAAEVCLDAVPIRLWQVLTLRCLLTPPRAAPPFVVEIYAGDVSIFRQEFASHNEATQAAIAAMPRA